MSCDDFWMADPKDPADTVWFKWDFSNWLQPGELLNTGVAPVMSASTGLTVGSGTFASGATCVLALVSSGTTGIFNTVSCEVQTTQSETVRRSIKFMVENR